MITVRINGSNRAVSAKAPVSFTIGLNRRGTAQFTLVSPDASFEPSVGQKVELFDEGTRVFTGTIDSIDKTLLLPTGFAVVCDCVSLEQRLDKRRLQPRTYVNITCGAIIIDMLSNIASNEAIQQGTITNGIVIDRLPVEEGKTVSALIDELADLSNFIWYVGADSKLNFHSPVATASPFTLTPTKTLRDGYRTKEARADFRNRQLIRLSWDTFEPYRELFDGNGVTQTFNLRRPLFRIDKITLAHGSTATGLGTFTGAPSDGDWIKIDNVPYTFRTTVNNRVSYDVRRGATAGEAAQNLRNAMNDTHINKGVDYSWPTIPHHNSLCEPPNGGIVYIRFGVTGAFANGTPLTSSGASFSWAGGAMGGGLDGMQTEQSFGIAGQDTDKQWSYQLGGQSITQALGQSPVPLGTQVHIEYRPLGADIITVEDTAVIAARAAIEGGSGVYEHLVERATKQSIYGDALAEANAMLDTFNALSLEFNFRTNDPGLMPGQDLTVSLPNPPMSISDNFLIESMTAEYSGTGTRLHFKNTFRCIDSRRVNAWLRFWERGFTGSGGSTGGSVTAIGGGGAAGGPASVVIEVNTAVGVTTITGPASMTAGDHLTVFIVQTNGNELIDWDTMFASQTATDLDTRAGKLTVYRFVGRSDHLWWQVGLPLMEVA